MITSQNIITSSWMYPSVQGRWYTGLWNTVMLQNWRQTPPTRPHNNEQPWIFDPYAKFKHWRQLPFLLFSLLVSCLVPIHNIMYVDVFCRLFSKCRPSCLRPFSWFAYIPHWGLMVHHHQTSKIIQSEQQFVPPRRMIVHKTLAKIFTTKYHTTFGFPRCWIYSQRLDFEKTPQHSVKPGVTMGDNMKPPKYFIRNCSKSLSTLMNYIKHGTTCDQQHVYPIR